MELKITGTPKEITDLVLGIQSQLDSNYNISCSYESTKEPTDSAKEMKALYENEIKVKLDAMG